MTESLGGFGDSHHPEPQMTNGGGVTEAERCTKLSRQLGVDVRPTI